MILTEEFFTSTGMTIQQPAKGHRYGEESLDLARYCDIAERDRACEFGSGCGVIALLLAASKRPKEIVGIEIQNELFEICLRNLSANRIASRVTFINNDYRVYAKENPLSFDHVLSNPPFYAVGTGRMGESGQRNVARHEIQGSLEELIASAHTTLKSEGHLWMVFPNARKDELIRKSEQGHFEVLRTEPSSNSTFLIELLKRNHLP